jgi:sugar phosphate isomerase/epimerase
VSDTLSIEIGVKADPIEYRYSYEWLFALMAEEGVHHVQVGSFFELYQLPDDYFVELRQRAANHGISLTSVFTTHRELGGWFRDDPRWEAVARRNFERLIEVGVLLGAKHVGSNPGAAMRDQMDRKPGGLERHRKHFKELMAFAHGKGLECLTVEPMSCIAEPPTLPEELRDMADDLTAHHKANPGTAAFGYCVDTSHGHADADGTVRHSNIELFEVALPYMVELHVKNTDAIFNSTFGFSPEERERGIVDLTVFRDMLHANAARLPVDRLVTYLEIGGPKLGRDYSDRHLGEALRTSLRHVKEVFAG